MPIRHALDKRLKHLLMPDQVARRMLRYRKQMGSTHIKALITKNGKKNSRALDLEVDKGLDIFRQWWVNEPPAEEGYRQPQHLRHSDLVYAVLRSARYGFTRYWRYRAVARISGTTVPVWKRRT